MILARFLLLLVLPLITMLSAAACTGSAGSTAATSTPESYLPVTVNEGTPVESLPDLVINSVAITLENARCYDGSSMGTRVNVSNIGSGDAGMFSIAIDDTSVGQSGLAAGETTSVWVSVYSNQPYVVVDADSGVEESNEDNNIFDDLVPIPTLPPPCA